MGGGNNRGIGLSFFVLCNTGSGAEAELDKVILKEALEGDY